MNKHSLSRLFLAAALLGITAACSSGSVSDDSETGDVGTPDSTDDGSVVPPFQELYDQGVDRYQGVFAPMQVNFLTGGVVGHTFDGSDNGPLCFTGNQFTMSTRDGTSSELMIFLQGGGACGPENCDAVDSAPPGIPPLGILNAADPLNPAGTYDVGYLPYCDGTLFTGDRDADSDGDGINDRFFRGAQNLSASLDVILNSYPSPSKILLTGNSAGGSGTHYALPLVRKLYPNVPIELVNDSGVGIMNPGGQLQLNEAWNSDAFFPDSCTTCIGDDGNLTDYHKWQLAEDMNLRMGFLSYKQDAVLDERLMIGGPAFEAQVLEAVAELEEKYPDRFRSLIANGDGHTFILRDFDYGVGGTTVRQWIANMLSESEDWFSSSD